MMTGIFMMAAQLSTRSRAATRPYQPAFWEPRAFECRRSVEQHRSLSFTAIPSHVRSSSFVVVALGRADSDHPMTMIKYQLKQVMEQFGCERAPDLPNHLVTSAS